MLEGTRRERLGVASIRIVGDAIGILTCAANRAHQSLDLMVYPTKLTPPKDTEAWPCLSAAYGSATRECAGVEGGLTATTGRRQNSRVREARGARKGRSARS